MASSIAARAHEAFRLDNDRLAFRLTATLSDRGSDAPQERLTDPARLELWLGACELAPERDATDADLSRAIQLREAIYRAGFLATRGERDSTAERQLNRSAAWGHPVPNLQHGRRTWLLTGTDSIADSLAVIARDAIDVIGGAQEGRIKVCSNALCLGLFADTSRGANRRWCSMNTCGNRAKKARIRGKRQTLPRKEEDVTV
ncbi:CGNR zinc finger domain-containing protein [Microbacterium amylolyticum]|uniref:RNA-binding Zn ribbon-like protein n=1 Tax=Microbacterium amylolyticum TaxID=936337 RepID=A0ABS4ZGQ9_9MICO|nr:ABATE domain-containing protein [Microbacterium amylolyticum]MBP2436193.1 putative RNA-binding Zn ribbon-like protein [Microbacterium amylolyticum]